VGLGGVWVEALDDVRLLAPDAPPRKSSPTIAKLRGASCCRARVAHAADLAALADIVRRWAP